LFFKLPLGPLVSVAQQGRNFFMLCIKKLLCEQKQKLFYAKHRKAALQAKAKKQRQKTFMA
jgi:hypothetical protein